MAVFIGFAGDLVHKRELRDVDGTKVGGAPVTPVSFDSAVFNDARCGLCSSPLALILQTHAPLNENQIGRRLSQRWLYVFGCVQKGCGNDSKCWKVFRLQPHSQKPMQDAAIVGDAPSIASERKIESIETGYEAEGEGHHHESFSLEGLKMALETSSTRNPKKKKSTNRANTVEMENGIEHDWDIQLPEFRINTQSESHRHDPRPDHAEDHHIQASLSFYNSQADAASDGWEEEAYEKHPHPSDRAFQKFKQTLQLCPKQCVRYNFHGAYLNPAVTAIKPPICSCGSPRVFELQLMPHLITAIYESGQCLQADADALDLRRCENAMLCFMEWDWMTVTVFTCLRSCQDNDLQECICFI